jgi:hypothetical protein
MQAFANSPPRREIRAEALEASPGHEPHIDWRWLDKSRSSTARLTYANKLCLIAASAIIVLSAGTASAQNYQQPGTGRYQGSRSPDPAQEAKRKAVDDAYKSLMEKIPDSKKSYDPWGNIRSTTTTPSTQRNGVK